MYFSWPWKHIFMTHEIQDKIGVFLSNDGGVTWTKVSDSPVCIEDGQYSCLLVR